MKNQPSKEYAESYQWWAEFLAARTQAIKSMMVLGKSVEEIHSTLDLGLGQCVGLMENVTKETI